VVTAATDSIVGEVSDDEAGVAGGIQTTAIQFGGVLGTAICGSILFSAVADSLFGNLTARGVPAELARQVAAKSNEVAQGLVPVEPGTSRAIVQAITDASHQAFMSGLHATMVVGGVMCVVGAILGLFMRPSKDATTSDLQTADL